MSDDKGSGDAEKQSNDQSETPVASEAFAAAVPASTTDWELQRDAHKVQGDVAFRERSYETAIHHYSAALSVDPENAKLLSNRSAAYLKAGQRSRALHDAQACVKAGYGTKGYSRLAAALQSLGRYQQALDNWKLVLEQEVDNAAAKQGVEDCTKALPAPTEEEEAPVEEDEEEEKDELDDFFDEVEEAVETVHKEKTEAAQPKATRIIAKHKSDLGTVHDQIERLLADNYEWRNLNPFFVLDLPLTASTDDISQRYKALSLLLHPDKNRDEPRAKEAFDEVKKAKAVLDDDTKARYTRQLAEEGMLQGKEEWKKAQAAGSTESLDSFQTKAVQRIFAQVEHSRRQVAKREREFELRTQQQEQEQLDSEKKERAFDKQWKDDQRVDKRIGNWRDFASKKKAKRSS